MWFVSEQAWETRTLNIFIMLIICFSVLKVQAKLDNIIYFCEGLSKSCKASPIIHKVFLWVVLWVRPLNYSCWPSSPSPTSPLYPCGMQTPRRYHSTSAKWHSDLPGLGNCGQVLQLPKSAKSSNCGKFLQLGLSVLSPSCQVSQYCLRHVRLSTVRQFFSFWIVEKLMHSHFFCFSCFLFYFICILFFFCILFCFSFLVFFLCFCFMFLFYVFCFMFYVLYQILPMLSQNKECICDIIGEHENETTEGMRACANVYDSTRLRDCVLRVLWVQDRWGVGSIYKCMRPCRCAACSPELDTFVSVAAAAIPVQLISVTTHNCMQTHLQVIKHLRQNLCRHTKHEHVQYPA